MACRLPLLSALLLITSACVETGRPVVRGESGSSFGRVDAAERRDGDEEWTEGAQEWLLSRYRVNGTIPPDAWTRAMAERERLQNGSTPADGGVEPGSWTWLGPHDVGGRVRALWIDPADTDVLLVGSASGGMWRSTDRGTTWRPVDDFLPAMSITQIVSNGAGRLLAATGEVGGSASGRPGAGIFHSDDKGATWHHLDGSEVFGYVQRIAVRPSDPYVWLVAATRNNGSNGVFRTTMSRSSAGWTLMVTQVLSSSHPSVGGWDVDFHPTDAQRAVASQNDGALGRVYWSSDGGRTFQPGSGLPPSETNRIELAYARSDPTVVYASLDSITRDANNTILTWSAIYRSVDGGRNWSLRNNNGRNDYLNGQGAYDNAIWVDPTNSSVIVVGGKTLWRSTDGGTTLRYVGAGTHADDHLIVSDPRYDGSSNRRVYLTTDGGVYSTNDIRATPPVWTNLSTGLGITQFYGGALTADGRPVGGSQDNGSSIRIGSSSSTSWSVFLPGWDGGMCAAHPTDPAIVYSEAQRAKVIRMASTTSAQNIVDGTNMTEHSGAQFPWIAPLVLDPNRSNRLYVGSLSLWRTDNPQEPDPTRVRWSRVKAARGSTWLTTVAVSPHNSSLILVGDRVGRIAQTVEGELSSPQWFDRFRSNLGRACTDIEFSPVDPNLVIASFGGFLNTDAIMISHTGGSSWAPMVGRGSSALPSAPVHAVAFHPRARDWIYAATEIGLFVSTDLGQTWSTSNDGPASAPVFDLLMRPDGELYAFTHGRGAYRANAWPARDPDVHLSRTSLTWVDTEGNGASSTASVSSNGRIVSFTSSASDLVVGDTNGAADVFVRDRQLGSTIRASVDSNERQGNGASGSPEVSRSGRYAAFVSAATNLVSGDTNGLNDVFVRDLQGGITERTSVTNTGGQANGSSSRPSITSDGRFIVFTSRASNLTPGDTNGVDDVFVRDRVAETTRRVSERGFFQGNGRSFAWTRAVSEDGRLVVFSSSASNLVSGDANGQIDVFARNMESNSLELVSIATSGAQGNGPSYSSWITPDGRFVVFGSHATNLVSGDTNGVADVFVRDIQARRTIRVSVSSGSAQSNGHSWYPTISDDGRFVAFACDASNLFTPDLNGVRDVFVRDIQAGNTAIVSYDSDLLRIGDGTSSWPVITADGGHVVFESDSTDLIRGDGNGVRDVFVWNPYVRSTVLPTETALADGSTWTSMPFSQSGFRLQQAARETRGWSSTIRRIRFRGDTATGSSLARKRTIDVEVRMGPCDIDALRSDFDNFIGPSHLVVSRKPIALPDLRVRSSGVAPFDIAIPLDVPYVHDGRSNLLIEIVIYANTSTGTYPIDAHTGLLSATGASQSLGGGCQTTNGVFGHDFVYTTDGPSSNLRLVSRRAPSRTPVTCLIGLTNPNLDLPGVLCTRLMSDGGLAIPIGTTNASGIVRLDLPMPAWIPGFRGLRLYSQMVAPDPTQTGLAFALSNGRGNDLPTDAGALVRRVFATSPTATLGSVSDQAAVLRLDGSSRGRRISTGIAD